MSTHHTPASTTDVPSPNRSPREIPREKPGSEAEALAELLATFHATCLGEGDVNAGANALVARAVLLSNLSRTGCGIEHPGLNRQRAGASLFVSGGSSSSLVAEAVTEVAIRQNNLTAQIERLIRDKVAEARKQGQKAAEFPSGPRANVSENALFQLEQADSLIPVDPLEEWNKVLCFPPNPRIENLAARPKVLVTAKGPRDLGKQLNGLHGNRPLVSLSLKDPAEAGAYAETCHALLGGPYPVGEFGETVMANLIVTDPGSLLPRIAATEGNKAAWIGRMVWLVDGTTGPDAAENTPAPGRFHLSDTGGRFGSALNAVLAKRLNNRNAGTVLHPFDLVQAQIRWVNFLKGMEGRLPGITGTARGLLATLAFGLIELAQAPGCKRLTVTPEGVEALGRWVIRRMANARVAMLKSAEIEEKQRLANQILRKLGDGPRSKRDLYRTFTISAAYCEEMLVAMEPAGLIRRVDGGWERTHEGPPPESRVKELFLETYSR
jgi:hypothetical protein